MRRLLMVALALLCTQALHAQTMTIHKQNQILRVSLDEADSVSFSDEVPLVPASIELFVDEVALDGGGAIWNLQVTALVKDIYGVPVPDGMWIRFAVSPEIVHITDAKTGNRLSTTGPSIPGAAHAVLLYHSNYTRQEVLIEAQVGIGEHAITTAKHLVLPIQDPLVRLSADPGCTFIYNQHVDYVQTKLEITVRDGHLHLVGPGVEVLFTSQYGWIYEDDRLEPYGEQQPHAVTDEDGIARRWLLLPVELLTSTSDEMEIPCTIRGEIVGLKASSTITYSLITQR